MVLYQYLRSAFLLYRTQRHTPMCTWHRNIVNPLRKTGPLVKSRPGLWEYNILILHFPSVAQGLARIKENTGTPNEVYTARECQLISIDDSAHWSLSRLRFGYSRVVMIPCAVSYNTIKFGHIDVSSLYCTERTRMSPCVLFS